MSALLSSIRAPAAGMAGTEAWQVGLRGMLAAALALLALLPTG